MVFVIVVLMVTVLVGHGFAEQNSTRYGLGPIIFEGKDGLVSQVCMVTTNGTLANQTLGITSGTSNCESLSSFPANERRCVCLRILRVVCLRF
ncbi:MAG: DUF3015 family protein [Desulfobacterales bacterium]|nr:DUF3015 family protein [Desulfobacterales bacterium]